MPCSGASGGHVAASGRPPIGWSVRLTAEGLLCGTDAVLARMVDLEGGTGRLASDVDRGRLLTLLSVAAERPVEAEAVMPAIEAAARYWQRGDKALANLRLVFSPLPRPADEAVVRRLSLASRALSNGMAPATLLRAAWSRNFRGLTLRYDPDQPRIPGGHGIESGRWTFAETGDPKYVARDRRIQVAEDDDPKVTSDLPLPNHAEVEHNATASVVLDHHRIHVLDPVSHLPGGIVRPSLLQVVKEVAGEALIAAGPGKGPVYGTAVHQRMRQSFEALKHPFLEAEVSYLDGFQVVHGTKGSVRFDAIGGPEGAPEAIFDLKTGGAILTRRRANQLKSHLPKDRQNIPMIELKP